MKPISPGTLRRRVVSTAPVWFWLVAARYPGAGAAARCFLAPADQPLAFQSHIQTGSSAGPLVRRWGTGRAGGAVSMRFGGDPGESVDVRRAERLAEPGLLPWQPVAHLFATADPAAEGL